MAFIQTTSEKSTAADLVRSMQASIQPVTVSAVTVSAVLVAVGYCSQPGRRIQRFNALYKRLSSDGEGQD